MIHRLVKPLKSRSFFLFGARGTGKTTFVHQQFLRDCPSNKLLTLDLLDYSTYEKFRKHPELLEEINFNKLEWVLIDEVQRIPALLNHIHRICEKKIKTKFILTGSSSRKLKREGANLLAGRAFYQSLFPFTSFELAANFNLEKSLNFGLLPEVFNFQSQDEIIAYLQTYVRIYIKEEILVEQLVRKIDPFRNFLEITAQMNAAPLNFSKIAKEIGVDTKTVQEYFSILVDTWLGIYLPSYHKSVRKSQVVAPKFYLFDPGVKRGLEGTLKQELTLNSFAYGHAFEHLVTLEIYKLNQYLAEDYKLSYLRTKDGAEVDLILSRGKENILIEIKSSQVVDEIEVRKLAKFAPAFSKAKLYYLSRDPLKYDIEGVFCRQWQEGIAEIFHIIP